MRVRVQRASREAVDGALHGGDGDNVAGWGIHESKRASRGDRGERRETRVGEEGRGGGSGGKVVGEESSRVGREQSVN